MSEPKQVIIIRTDTEPKMRKGKMIAQGSHASMKAILDSMEHQSYKRRGVPNPDKYPEGKWLHPANYTEKTLKLVCTPETPLTEWLEGLFTKVVVKGTLDEISHAYNEAKNNGMICSLITDKGLTEFGGKETVTAAAIGPDYHDKID